MRGRRVPGAGEDSRKFFTTAARAHRADEKHHEEARRLARALFALDRAMQRFMARGELPASDGGWCRAERVFSGVEAGQEMAKDVVRLFSQARLDAKELLLAMQDLYLLPLVRPRGRPRQGWMDTLASVAMGTGGMTANQTRETLGLNVETKSVRERARRKRRRSTG